ncbi:MAG: 3'(2'),5'-bisphosphate nucleotidase CysQ [Candidatus Pacebacteria bacterium]|nr:3'(2'),5'-bisphosphate nucleotidase CysQ [Candidatus Paceibacterota bacterium]
MSDNPFAEHLPAVLDIALRAGDSILYHYHKQSGATGFKQDGSPVTEADRASEAVIVFGLEYLTPQIPILSEEQVALGKIPDLSGGVYWCVDPLDGTKEYLKRTDEFTVCIGGIMAGQAVFGLLVAPVLGLVYASDGRQAWKRDGQGRLEAVACRARPVDESQRVTLVSRSHRDGAELDEFLLAEGFPEASRRTMGSAIKFGQIAEGAADLYARFGPTNQWDTAAGQAVLEAAGGSVRTHDGDRLCYDPLRFANPPFIAMGRGI